MLDVAPKPMSADEFLAWAQGWAEGERYELIDGEPWRMPAERVEHARAKGEIYVQLRAAIHGAGLPCEAFTDGVAVVIDERTIYEPDAMLRCGPPLPGSQVRITDPLLVVEVLSRSTGTFDVTLKLTGYFRLPSLHHYLVVIPETRTVIHYARGDGGAIIARILGDGPLRLDPPGLVLDDLFGPA
jgi:Uma2 family endonuclease